MNGKKLRVYRRSADQEPIEEAELLSMISEGAFMTLAKIAERTDLTEDSVKALLIKENLSDQQREFLMKILLSNESVQNMSDDFKKQYLDVLGA